MLNEANPTKKKKGIAFKPPVIKSVCFLCSGVGTFHIKEGVTIICNKCKGTGKQTVL